MIRTNIGSASTTFTDEQPNIRSELERPAKAVWIESPTNPCMNLVDLAAVAGIARERGVLTICDNTFLSPYFQRPLAHGIDARPAHPGRSVLRVVREGTPVEGPELIRDVVSDEHGQLTISHDDMTPLLYACVTTDIG